jgi:hypothetical protein
MTWQKQVYTDAFQEVIKLIDQSSKVETFVVSERDQEILSSKFDKRLCLIEEQLIDRAQETQAIYDMC